uniref:N-fatty-acyl-amino acid synthase/hydrolase PM20D1-like n=1 Tax=Styela clava TaxID=7725 RepID=UPI0019399320|nr:N-fatty-acyl-amino acid synthase/hydrolase PM20D1-like [Styela clava]
MAKIRNICKYFAMIVGVVILVCIIRTFVLVNITKKKLPKCAKNETLGYFKLNDVIWERFKDTLRMRTVTHEMSEIQQMLNYVIEAHPKIFKSKHVQYEIVNGYSLLIHVQGRDKTLLPYLLASHLDVVPVVEDEWHADPFDATENKDGTIVYARGAIDDKGSLMSKLAALEFLLHRGILPKRSFYLGFGHDEEVLGPDGAPHIAKRLIEKDVNKLHFVLDEGMVVMKDVIPGSNKELAVIGVTERGFINLNISVEIHGGHSSIPHRETAVGVLGNAVSRLQYNQMPGRIDSIVAEFLDSLAPELSFPLNVFACNLWLFNPLWWRLFSLDNKLQGIVRTTTAVTIMRAGEKFNVIPSTAWAVVNQRTHHMDTVTQVMKHNKNVINDDRVQINITRRQPPHPISPFDRSTSLPYQVISDTIDQIFDEVVIVPATLVANTDTRCYLNFTKNIYRFNPISLTIEDIATIHAMDERISKKNFERMINFFYHLMWNADRIQPRDLTSNKQEL